MTARHSVLRLILLLCALLGSAAGLAQPARDGVVPYRAVYGLYNGDKRVGESVFELSYDSATGRYGFESRSEFRGLLQFASPRPVVEHSEFTVVANEIHPLAFTYQDGTWRGRRNFDLHFDWNGGHIIAERDGMSEELPLIPGALDRASVHVALMRELAMSQLSDSYGIADSDGIRTYANRDEGTESVATPLGRLTVQKVSQHRPESSRRTLIWAARELHFLPIRIEQLRDGRAPVAFALESVEWLTGAGERGSP